MKLIEKKITIIIPSRKIDKNLKFCVKKIRKFYNKIKIILILDYINKSFFFDKNIQIIKSSKKTIGAKRNLGVRKSKTKYICFIDSDAYPISPWLKNTEKAFNYADNIGAVGGPNLSPSSKNLEERLVASIKKNGLFTINKELKIKSQSIEFVNFLHSCNFIIKKTTYNRLNGMFENIYSGEEVSLNYKLLKSGYKLLSYPTIIVNHKDRNFKNFMKQRFIYGSTGLKLFIKYPCITTLKLLLSSVPVLFLFLFPIFFFCQQIKNITLFFFIIFIFAIIANTIKIYEKGSFFKSLKLVIISIISPGIGLLLSFFLSNNKFQKLYTQN